MRIIHLVYIIPLIIVGQYTLHTHLTAHSELHVRFAPRARCAAQARCEINSISALQHTRGKRKLHVFMTGRGCPLINTKNAHAIIYIYTPRGAGESVITLPLSNVYMLRNRHLRSVSIRGTVRPHGIICHACMIFIENCRRTVIIANSPMRRAILQ